MKRILTIPFVLLQLTVAASAIQVGADKACKTIHHALDMAKDGDCILVDKGSYAEGEILINKKVRLQGLNWPLIDGRGKSQVFRIESNGVVIEGMDIRNAGYSSSYDWAAVKVINSRNVIIRNNRMLNNAAGVYLQNTDYSEVSNNQIRGNTVDEVESGNAVHCWKCDHVSVVNNNLSGHRDGLYFEFVTASLVKDNSSCKNLRYGIHFMFSHNDTYIHNVFRANGAGVAVMFSKGVVMRSNRFEESRGSSAYGLLLKEISDGVIESNTFMRNTVGIYMEGASRILVSKNSFTSNGWAMHVQASCEGNTIIRNNYMGNTFDVSTNGELQLNKFISNYWDKYEGYDLDKNGYGDIHYMPVSLYSMIVEKMPAASLLLKSFMVTIMDKAERMIPSITPVELKDDKPSMKPWAL